ncbi:MAG: hypothetical protein J6X62_06750 [Bacteroidales bacterium]|nr:hypothetical protein [Bacteroidales bacterium]
MNNLLYHPAVWDEFANLRYILQLAAKIYTHVHTFTPIPSFYTLLRVVLCLPSPTSQLIQHPHPLRRHITLTTNAIQQRKKKYEKFANNSKKTHNFAKKFQTINQSSLTLKLNHL